MPDSAGAQLILGAVPWIKYSYLGVGEQETLSLTIDFGGTKAVAGLSFNKACIVLAQIGEAPVIPEATEDIGELSLLPTQIATKISGV